MMRSNLGPALVLGVALGALLLGGAQAAGTGAGAASASASRTAASGPTTPPGASALVVAASHGEVVPPSLRDVEHMCAMLLGCPDVPLPLPGKDLGACVRHYWQLLSSHEAVRSSLTIRECGLNAISCQQLTRCALRGANPASCDGRGMGESTPVGRCDIGGRAIQCLEGKIVGVRDCQRGGELCSIRQGEADCITGQCSQDSKASCSPDGQRIVQCKGGRLTGMNCSAFGLQCITDASGEPHCTAQSAPACQASSDRCEGNASIGCLDGREIRVECDKAKLLCGASMASGAPVGACKLAQSTEGQPCDPSKTQSRCEGNSVAYCLGGKMQRFSCRGEYELKRCAGQPGQAHCE